MDEALRSELIIANSKVFLMRMEVNAKRAPMHMLVDAMAVVKEIEARIGIKSAQLSDAKVCGVVSGDTDNGTKIKNLSPSPSPVERGDVKREQLKPEFKQPLFAPEKKWDDVILGKKASVMSKIHELVKDEAEKSNALAMCDPSTNQARLCAELIEGRKLIEKHYDLWYYMHRNNALPPTLEDIMTAKEKDEAKKADPDRATKLAVVRDSLRSWQNKADKARRELRNIGNTSADKHKRQARTEELTLKIKSCEAEVKRLTAERDSLL